MSAPSRHVPRPCHWCGRGTLSPRRVCAECVTTDRRADHESPESAALRGGNWVPRGVVQVWQPLEPTHDGRAKCGTPGGYYSHLRHTKTEPCGACRQALAEDRGAVA